MVDPSFFDEGDEQRAGLLGGPQAECGAGSEVGVRLHGGGGGEDEDFGAGEAGLFAAMASAVARAPGSMTPMTGTRTAARISSSARAVAVLQAMTRSSAPRDSRKRALSTA